ncbi:unnamed protein product [Darwinula stevensoni]|uniref:Uncharacterized protein n=1 Tax=Darwinula stevensoni TaxID=69355 RepID=A0A7R9AC85_9CRUS|nr:unnamed protein product [Darwinula stevensoni]CAG0899604.1 unnamed protein product [Darwinula stevensoni]
MEDIAHGALCSLFYLASGGILTDTGSDVKGYKEGKMMLASGVFSIFLGIVFIADVLFVYFKERRASA